MEKLNLQVTIDQFNQIMQIITNANAPFIVVSPLVQTLQQQAQEQVAAFEKAQQKAPKGPLADKVAA